jgi:hypothetical protein
MTHEKEWETKREKVREVIRAQRACGFRAPSGVGETMGQSGPDVSGNKETMSVVLKKQEETRTLIPWDSGFK